jgi:hypothetical protein
LERKRARGLAFAVLAAAGLGCATSVRVDFDPQADFASYRTWAWLPPSWEIAASRSDVDPELDALLRGAIERELAARGYARAGELRPDFLVTYHLRLRRQLVRAIETPAMETLHSPHREGGYEVSKSEPRVQPYELGMLVLDVAEGRERQLVWRGIGTRRVRTSFKRRAEAVVGDIFEAFPPDGGSGS